MEEIVTGIRSIGLGDQLTARAPSLETVVEHLRLLWDQEKRRENALDDAEKHWGGKGPNYLVEQAMERNREDLRRIGHALDALGASRE